MSLKTILSSLIFLLLTVGCKESNQFEQPISDGHTLEVQADWFETDLKVLNSFSAEYIALETTDNSLVGSIADFKLDEGYIFVLDKHVAKSLLIFDESGNFKAKINQTGRGPNEINAFNCFTLNRKNKEIVISDLGLRKVLIFDYAGNFKKEVKNPQWYSRIEWLNNDNYLYYLTHYNVSEKSSGYSEKGPLVVIGSLEGKANQEFFLIKDKPSMTTIVEAFSYSRNADEVLFTKALDPTVYRLNKENKVQQVFTVDFGRYALPDSYLNLPVTNYRDYLMRTSYSQLSEVASTGGYYAFSFENPVKMPGLKVLIQALQPKDFSQSMKYYLPTNLPNDKGVMLPQIKEAFGENFYGLFDAEEIISANTSANGLIYEMFPDLEKRSLKETDNPVLVKISVHE